MNLLHSLNTFRYSIVRVYSEFQTYKSVCTNHWCVYKSRRLDSFCYFSWLFYFFYQNYVFQYLEKKSVFFFDAPCIKLK